MKFNLTCKVDLDGELYIEEIDSLENLLAYDDWVFLNTKSDCEWCYNGIPIGVVRSEEDYEYIKVKIDEINEEYGDED